jgi:S-DNA-T family DNA segregation ATPase FtsK/SpoIIIE
MGRSAVASSLLPDVCVGPDLQANPDDRLPQQQEIKAEADRLLGRLSALGIVCELERAICGPRLTLYELRPAADVQMRELTRAADDLAFVVGGPARVLAPLPGRPGLVGVEVTSAVPRVVRFDELPPAREPLSFPLGLALGGEPVYCDLAGAPHLLVGGQTGGGKSSLINALLCSLLSRFGPDALGLVLVDLKRVELLRYANLPHLLAAIADDVRSALSLLRGLVRLMELRYKVSAQFGARSLPGLNEKLADAGHDPYPYVVCVVDELADLVLAAGREAESLLVRLAQKSRAVGIHLVLATQSPRVAVVTGLLKANVPSRVCFSVPSMTDSRVILDSNGAETLLGAGDGLFSDGGRQMTRFQGALIEADEIESICDRWRA